MSTRPFRIEPVSVAPLAMSGQIVAVALRGESSESV